MIESTASLFIGIQPVKITNQFKRKTEAAKIDHVIYTTVFPELGIFHVLLNIQQFVQLKHDN